MCVLKIAMDVFDLGIEPIVLVDCCASTAGLQAHLSGLAILSRNIGPHQLRLTKLHEGYLAAPKGEPTPTPAPLGPILPRADRSCLVTASRLPTPAAACCRGRGPKSVSSCRGISG